MNALKNYGSEDESSSSDDARRRKDYHPSWSRSGSRGGSGAVQADANYEEVQMDMSEDSDSSRGSRDPPSSKQRHHSDDNRRSDSRSRDTYRSSRNDERVRDNDRKDDRESDKRDDRSRDSRYRDDKHSKNEKDDDRNRRDNRSRDDDRERRDDRYNSRGDRDNRDKDDDRDRDRRDRYKDRRDRRESSERRDRRESPERRDRRDSPERKFRGNNRRRESRSPRNRRDSRSKSRSRSRERYSKGYQRRNDRGGRFGPNNRPDFQRAAEEQKQAEVVPKDRFFVPGITGRFRDQIEKRKLLWKKETPATVTEAGQSSSVPTGIIKPPLSTTSAISKKSVWDATAFAQDTDGKVASKFKRLMGMRAPEEPEKAKPPSDLLKRQEEMFSSMEAQYEVARTATHTMRGVGLGFGSYQR